MYKIFVSMRFKNRTEEEVNKILKSVEEWFKVFRPAVLQDGEEIKAVCNYWCKVPKGMNRKLWQLGSALQLMAECQDFVFIKEDARIPKGCELEIEAWKSSEEGQQIFSSLFGNERQYFNCLYRPED